MKPRSVIKSGLFASMFQRAKIDELGDPLLNLDACIDFAALAQAVDAVAPRPAQPKGGRPPYPTATMVRLLVLKRLHNLSDEQLAFQLLDRMSFKRFCGLSDAITIPDRTTVWLFENRIGEAGAQAIFDGMDKQLLQKGCIARGGQMVDATLVPAPRQHFSRFDKEQLAQNVTPAEWSAAKRRQKDADATWTQRHGQYTHSYKLSINADVKYKCIRKIVTDTASTHNSQHFERIMDKANTSRNRRIVKIRARVEHVFGAIAHMGGKCIRTIGQARANFAMTMGKRKWAKNGEKSAVRVVIGRS